METTKYLDAFPEWLTTLGADAQNLASLLRTDGVPDATRQAVAGGLNYLFQSLDLIPDGIEDLGFLDDAFVLRVAADLAARNDLEAVDETAVSTVERLAGECELVREFLNDDYDRFETYVKGLVTTKARGRATPEILADAGVRDTFVSEVDGFASEYEAPVFHKEEKNLIKLRAFFDARLPRKPLL
ncbi:MAG: YkvA family protein [Polyangiales bacterium]|nr:DUF1232 domain-containing protein [Myxococcales bacterium]